MPHLRVLHSSIDTHPGRPDSTAGAVRLICDAESYEFHIDAACGYSAAAWDKAILLASEFGLICDAPPETLDDGAVRIWLTPTGALADDLNPLQS